MNFILCGDSRTTHSTQALKARRLKAQELAVTPTCTLSDRQGHNFHPAGLPKFQHSKEQVEAEHEAKKKAAESRALEVQKATEHLTQLTLLEECKDDFPLQHSPCLSAMIQKQHCIDMEPNSDECFDLREANHGSDLDFESESYKAC